MRGTLGEVFRVCSNLRRETATAIMGANAGARTQGGLTPDFLALSIINANSTENYSFDV